MLRVENISVAYGSVKAVHGVSFEVKKGEIVALLGANGAGKTTCLKTIAGLMRPISGNIYFKDKKINGLPANKIARMDISLVPEGRRIFPGLTVYENLEVSATASKHAENFKETLADVFSLFPRLEERKNQLGWSLSGGEQQMLAIGRAMVSKAELIMFDEASLGLAPNLVIEVMQTIVTLNKRGISVLLVEQNAKLALEVASRAYVLKNGEIVISGKSEELKNDPSIKKAYLGQ